jgi:peptidoglycan/LPS O-acetylase OafA/YrhL
VVRNPPYRPDIDGLRAVAVVAVVAYHTGLPGVRGGFTGVDIFFVISGYLITGLLLLDIEQHRRVQILKFYARRARRILPTLLLVALTTVFVSAWLLSPGLGEVQRVSQGALATLLMSANFYFLHATGSYFAVRSEFQPLLHTWSLSVEEQFYFLWPTTLAAAYALFARFRAPVLWVGATTVVLITVSAVGAVVLAASHNAWAFYFTAARGWELGTGGLLAIGLPSVRGVPRRWCLTASVLGIALIVAGIATIQPDRSSPLLMAAFPVLGTSLVVAGNTFYPTGPVGRILSVRAMVQVGLASYAWYLWHWPALSIARILRAGSHDLLQDCIISIATLAVSFLTLRWYERPLRYHAGIRAAPAKLVVLAGCGATLTAAALVFGVDAWSQQTSRTAAEIALMRAKDDTAEQGQCLLSLGSAEGETAPTDCLASGNRPRVILWGDSIADRFSPALHEWASRHGVTATVEQLTKPACPPVLNSLPTQPLLGAWKPYYGCRSFNAWVENRFSLAATASNRSGVLLSAAWWPRATDYDLRRLGGIESRHSFDISATTTKDSLSVFEAAMRSTLRDITDHGLRAVIVLQTPILVSPGGGDALDAPDCLFRKNEHDCAMALAVHRQLADPVNRILTRLAGEFPDVRVFDPAPFLCPEERCPARIDGIVAYTDYEHISATMARALTGALVPYLDWLTAPRPMGGRQQPEKLAPPADLHGERQTSRWMQE